MHLPIARLALALACARATVPPSPASPIEATGSPVRCANCPGRACRGAGLRQTINGTTLGDVHRGVGLVDCLCVVCAQECGTGRAAEGSLLALQPDWATPLWHTAVAYRGGTCAPSGCKWADVCIPSWAERPRPAGPFLSAMDTVGYMPHDVGKVATVLSAEPCGEEWELRRHADGSLVARGVTEAPREPPDDGSTHPFERVGACFVDFSNVTAAGLYDLQTRGGNSTGIVVDANVYRAPLKQALAAFYMARCGQRTEPLSDPDLVTASLRGISVRPFAHDECHMEDGFVDERHTGEEGLERHRDGTGGFHDAGDYGKYTVNTAMAVGVLLHAWQHHAPALKCLELDGLPRAHPVMPYVLEEARYGLDWMLKMQKRDGRVYHKLTPSRFVGRGTLPDADRAKRFFAPWGTAATADLVAVAALGARMYAPFDPAYADALMDAALRSYAVLAAHPTEVIPDLSAFSTGDYVGQFNGNPNHDRGVRIWALSELYESTGNATFLDELEAHLSFFDTPTAQCAGNRDPLSMCKVADLVEWNQQRDMGIVPYLLSARSPDLRNASLVAEVGEQLRLVVDKWARTASYDPFGRHMGDFTKFGVSVWGINGEAARHALLFETARRALGVDHTRVSAATLHHLLGRNEERRSWVLKLGFNPPENPHHRPSFVFKDTWPGLLVGGPFPEWRDEWRSFASNEVAINWQAALVYALSALAPASCTSEAGPRKGREGRGNSYDA